MYQVCGCIIYLLFNKENRIAILRITFIIIVHIHAQSFNFSLDTIEFSQI